MRTIPTNQLYSTRKMLISCFLIHFSFFQNFRAESELQKATITITYNPCPSYKIEHVGINCVCPHHTDMNIFILISYDRSEYTISNFSQESSIHLLEQKQYISHLDLLELSFHPPRGILFRILVKVGVIIEELD